MGYVVVVESDKRIAKVLAEYFRSEGYRCGVAHSKSVAQRFLRHIRPDLLLIECQLCDGDGL